MIKYTESELKLAIATSCSYRQVLIKLGLKPAGGNYDSLKKRITTLNLDVSHFTHQGWSKDQQLGSRRDISDHLTNKYPIQSYKLKLKLLRAGIKQHRCEGCHLTEWLGKPIPLELDHINGNNQDNSLSNLRLLCPNCHCFTPTYRGKKKRRNPELSSALAD
ncbi:MAG: HNH endonuclease [Alkalinema sp. RU_4_3]|nr:HNH endonuclease [Alkalinema sp. RU_4_3]